MSQTFKIDIIRCTAIYIWLSSHLKKDRLLKADLFSAWGLKFTLLFPQFTLIPSFQQNYNPNKTLNIKYLHEFELLI